MSAVLALLALTWAGAPAEAGIGAGIAVGWLVAAVGRDPHERVLDSCRTDDYLLHFEE